ncbi:MAG: hypothetical protein R6W85_01360 [Gillisia sp.]
MRAKLANTLLSKNRNYHQYLQLFLSGESFSKTNIPQILNAKKVTELLR